MRARLREAARTALAQRLAAQPQGSDAPRSPHCPAQGVLLGLYVSGDQSPHSISDMHAPKASSAALREGQSPQ